MSEQNAVDWRSVADVLATELGRWGWGDMHYGDQPQERSVVDALAVYKSALIASAQIDGSGS